MHRGDAAGQPGSIYEHFERLVLLPADEQQASLAALHRSNSQLAVELERLLLADRQTNPLDAVADGGGRRLAEALADFDAPEDALPQVPGYGVLDLLGEGGMGRVYLGERDVQGYTQRVAIKRVRRDRAAPIFQARFLAEQRHLAALDHPGICRFIEAGVLEDGSSFVVMEAVEGLELIEFCEAMGLDLEQRVVLLRRLLDAVAHAHERLLIHRDLKPSNVLVTADGQPKLLDFGISKSLAASAAESTSTADRFFSLTATSPEQLLGQPLGVGCDIYALGLLAYRLLAGRAAYELNALTPAEAEAQILHRAPPAMSSAAAVSWAARLRGDLDSIVLRCLRKQPSERYPNVRALDADLARWQRHLPISSRESEFAYRARLFLRRNYGRVLAATAAAVALAMAAAGFWLQAREVELQRTIAVEERDRAVLLSQILEGAFIEADPARAGGEGVSVRAILDAVQSRLADVEERNPPLFASLAASIARVEVELGADANAADLSTRALAALEGHAEDPQLKDDLRLLAAEAFSRSGRTADAERLLDEARRDGGEDRWAWQYAMARLDMDRGLREEAENRLKSLLARDSSTSTQNGLKARRLLVETLAVSVKDAEAIAVQQQLYREVLRSAGPAHPSVLLEELELLRLTSFVEPNPDDLPSRFERVIASLGTHYRQDSPVLAGAHAAAARAYLNAARSDEAVDSFGRALMGFGAALGESHARSLRARFNLAAALHGSGRPDEAIETLAELRRLSERHHSPIIPLAVRAALLQARIADELGLTERGLLLLRDMQGQLAHLPDADTRRRAVEQTLSKLAESACRRARPPLGADCAPVLLPAVEPP